MRNRTVLTATLLLGNLALIAVSQQRDSSTIRWRGGRALAKELAEIPNDTLPLLLAIEFPRRSILAGENFPIRFVVTNPNTRALSFPGAGWTLPRLYASTSDEDLALLVDRSFAVHAGEMGELTLGPGESATMTITKVYARSGAVATGLYAETGYTLRLRGAGVVKTIAVDEPGCPELLCEWVSEEIQVPVRAPTPHERNAYHRILDWKNSQRPPAPGISHEEWRLTRVDFHRTFLNEYGDTPYANQVRVLLLRDLTDLPRQRSGNDQEPLPPFFPLYVKTVSELLDAGVPYASKVNRGVLETLGMARRWDLVATALEKLLRIAPAERTLDHTFATVAREYCAVLRPEAREFIGEAASSIQDSVLACIARCAAWESSRAVPYDGCTFAFLSERKQWNLLELTARQTLEAARLRQDCGGQLRFGRTVVDEETIAAATEALSVSRRQRARQP